ncbi:MAG: hypothetical protein RL648_728 [Verrucomicrobiota bacterium]|jgi:tRNA nucleotidyltransferase (CCA-adding enzyme)
MIIEICALDPLTGPVLQKVAHACAAAGGRAYLVGGVVRSALLGEIPTDYDMEVFGLTEPQLLEALRGMGVVRPVGKAFGIYKLGGYPIDIGLPRREHKTGLGHRGFAVQTDPALSLREAALRRDFTVNALYMDILSGDVIDPLGGLADLHQRRIRHCSEQFAEDPLRVLRAMQFAARLEATVAPETVALCRGLSPEGLSAERFGAEWEKLLLKGRRPSLGLSFLKEAGWLAYFPELEALVGCPQDPRWHPEGDVWQHTLHCLDALPKLRMDQSGDDLTVALAVLCHDFGKPLTTEITAAGIRSPGHEQAGLEPASAFMQRLRISKRIQEAVLALVATHMRPATLYRDQSSSAALRRLANDCGRLDLLMLVFRADNAGRPGYHDDSAEAVRWIQERARLMNIEAQKPPPILQGRDLLVLGMTPGPAMGSLLRAAYEAQLDGLFEDYATARAWATAQLKRPQGGPNVQLPVED